MTWCQEWVDSRFAGILTVNNTDEVTSVHAPPVPRKVQAVAQKGKSVVLNQHQDCFDKVGRFPGEKYHIQLINNSLTCHPPSTSVPVDVLFTG